MTELDKAPDNVRRQMIELYVKRIDRIFRNGSGPRLRVDLLSVPAAFQNLAETVSHYTDRIARITRASAKQVDDFQKQYTKRNDEDKCAEPKPADTSFRKVDRRDDVDDDMPVFNFEEDIDEDDD